MSGREQCAMHGAREWYKRAMNMRCSLAIGIYDVFTVQGANMLTHVSTTSTTILLLYYYYYTTIYYYIYSYYYYYYLQPWCLLQSCLCGGGEYTLH